MRRVIFAPSFDAELFAISCSIEMMFGERVADEFEVRIQQIAATLAHSPLIGTQHHGYPTQLYGFVQSPNWIFYRFTETEVHFLHIRDGRRHKKQQVFGD